MTPLPPPLETAPPPRRARWGLIVLAALLFVAAAAGLWTYVRLPDARGLANENPPTTSLIEHRAEEAREAGKKPRRRQQWVPLKRISRVAVAAVLLSEDASFYQHEGVDTVELQKAFEKAMEERELGRGASTITQQLAKNLWLSNDRSLWRKAKELVLARRLEDALTKPRILTLYLNVVEWGQGVYGIEAAALEHFGVHASELTAAQGAMLASMLPSPRKRLPRARPLVLQKHALRLIARMAAVKRLSPEQALEARTELERFFGRSTAPAAEQEEQEEEVAVEPVAAPETAPSAPVETEQEPEEAPAPAEAIEEAPAL